jgi:hypothetical protein
MLLTGVHIYKALMMWWALVMTGGGHLCDDVVHGTMQVIYLERKQMMKIC